MTAYMSDDMKASVNAMHTKETQRHILNEWVDDIGVNQSSDYMYGSGGDIGYELEMSSFAAFGSNGLMNTSALVAERDELDVKLKIQMDSYLLRAWTQGTDYAFQHLIDLMIVEHISIDYQHSVSGIQLYSSAWTRCSLSCASYPIVIPVRLITTHENHISITNAFDMPLQSLCRNRRPPGAARPSLCVRSCRPRHSAIT